MNYRYEGSELELFSKAVNWKKYLATQLMPYIKGSVLEVGAGIGNTTPFLYNEQVEQWTCLEPDEKLFEQLIILQKGNAVNCIAKKGTLSSLNPDEKFDTIIYIDVLEHIENDRNEVSKAEQHAKAGGHIIVLSPAFSFLYSPFDKAIGHYRRYQRNDLKRLPFSSAELCKLKYLDSFGFLASLANRFFLKQAYPTPKQIAFWDHWLIPFSKIADKVFFYSFGKSILGVWRKKN
jgi:SAM-dependent methyltransferase